MRNLLKKILGKKVIFYINLYRNKTFWAYYYDLKQFINYSRTINNLDSEIKLRSAIISKYHVIEKGLTMPQMKLAFGKEIITLLIAECKLFAFKYGIEDTQVKHAVSVLLEYCSVHNEKDLLDPNLILSITNLSETFKVNKTTQNDYTRNDFFSKIDSPFPIFAESRKTVRNFSSVNIPISELEKAIKIAHTAPSSCNRQSTRIHIIENKNIINQILNIQGGCRGFGELANKLIIVTSDLRSFIGARERSAGPIDAGIYTMNLVYALHYYKIGSCILNWGVMPETDIELRNIYSIPRNEKVNLLIVCGYLPEYFKVANSERINYKEILTITQ